MSLAVAAFAVLINSPSFAQPQANEGATASGIGLKQKKHSLAILPLTEVAALPRLVVRQPEGLTLARP
jgi:hypothetical protein